MQEARKAVGNVGEESKVKDMGELQVIKEGEKTIGRGICRATRAESEEWRRACAKGMCQANRLSQTIPPPVNF